MTFLNLILHCADSQLGLDPCGYGKSVAVLDVLQDLVVGQTLKREAAEGDHFVEEDAERPDVGHGGEEAVGQ